MDAEASLSPRADRRALHDTNQSKATDHFKAYARAASNMIAKREVRAMSPVALNSRSH
jgi:quinol monooxygenase YgiN